MATSVSTTQQAVNSTYTAAAAHHYTPSYSQVSCELFCGQHGSYCLTVLAFQTAQGCGRFTKTLHCEAVLCRGTSPMRIPTSHGLGQPEAMTRTVLMQPDL